MYTLWIYNEFVQLRKQLYKLKTRQQIDKYTAIEKHRREYKTFRAFIDRINEYNAKFEYWEDCIDIQETFDDMLEASQGNTLKYLIQ